jgi:hypothetical protein
MESINTTAFNFWHRYPADPTEKNYAAAQYSNKTCKRNVWEEVCQNFIKEFQNEYNCKIKNYICKGVSVPKPHPEVRSSSKYATRYCTNPLDLTFESRLR